MKKGKRAGRIRRQYYDPGSDPKPRAVEGGEGLEATVAKETRQLRRERERDWREGK